MRGEPWPRGITLVDLTILTITLLILVSIGVPIVSSTVRQYRLKGAAWQLAGDLRLARQRAVATQKRFRVCISRCAITVPEGSYSVERDLGTPSSATWISETGAPVRLPADVAISANSTVTFRPNGIAAGATYSISNLIGSYAVTVDSIGQVTVTGPVSPGGKGGPGCKGKCS